MSNYSNNSLYNKAVKKEAIKRDGINKIQIIDNIPNNSTTIF